MSDENRNALRRLRLLLEAETSDSLEMLRDIKDNPICSVYVDQSVPCIVVTWRRYATSTQLRFVHETILHLIEKHRIGKVLGDDTSLPTIDEQDQRWILENWMPRAIAAGLRVTASKKPVSHFGKVSVDKIRSVAPDGIVMRAFDEIHDARDWLQAV